jgi:hypothetical protein
VTDTLKSMRAEVSRWLKGDLQSADGQSQINDAISDSVEWIWMAMMQIQLGRFLGADSPVTFSLPNNVERVKLVNTADPTIAPVTSTIAGGALAGRTYNIGYTYVTESGSETLQSPLSVQAVLANNLATVTAPAAVAGAFGWNLYAGVINQALQNQQPIPFGIVYQEQPSGFQDYPTFQQVPPLANTTADNVSWITHLEMKTTDNLLRAWNEYDLDSEVMRRMARTYPSSSQYSTYVWALTNGGTLEFRPTTGTAFNPRYWYVAKPRRLRYDQAEIPYTSITGVHEAIRNYTLNLCKLSLDEYLAAEHWAQAAEKNKLDVQLALNQENWAKNTRVTPYLF